MRKLASIQIISDLKPIRGADRIVQATVMGWNVVVKKDEFEVGDRCIFFEIDSILPDGPEWSEFMRPKKFRVKTCKLRGVLSQGLAMPLSILDGKSNPNRRFWDWLLRKDGWRVGDDVTNFLKIEKHGGPQSGKSPGFKTGSKAGNFPSFIPKTDEIRVQSAMHLLDRIARRNIYATVKCDGTSSTFYKLDGKFGVCSRNREVKPGDNVYWQVAEAYMLEQEIPDGLAVQGEICGPRIQKNRLRLESVDLFVFDVFDIKAGRYYSLSELRDFCTLHNLTMVPLALEIESSDVLFENSLPAWLERAKGKYKDTNVNREGLVVRTSDGDRVSFKVLNNDYLLKEED
jgi:RNA ligase (TIGR02306 family)